MHNDRKGLDHLDSRLYPPCDYFWKFGLKNINNFFSLMSNITEVKCPLGVLVIEPKTPKVRKKSDLVKCACLAKP